MKIRIISQQVKILPLETMLACEAFAIFNDELIH